jgi:glucosamine--fructose-6-phosphate aminotransferase (isomerizing)
MCGIVGAVGQDKTLRIVVDALKRLEYRGYDSFGVSTLQPDAITTKKDIGSIRENDNQGFFSDLTDSYLSVGHTRWATHGGVTQPNAHPHPSVGGDFTLVHNGVVENHRQLRRKLTDQGITFRSETDTEVIVQLLASLYGQTQDLLEAMHLTTLELDGEYSFVFLTTHDPDHIYGARYKSPLCFGRAGELTVLASDQTAIAPLTQGMSFLEDGDFIKASKNQATCYRQVDGKLTEVERPLVNIPWTSDEAGKQGLPHYMIKEVYETPMAAKNVLSIKQKDIPKVVADLAKKNLCITGAGSAFYVAQIGQYYFSSLAKTYACVHPSDEFLTLLQLGAQDHLIAVSQSGETFDTIEVIRAGLNNSAIVTSINNVFGSTCQRISTHSIFQGAGTEICVLSTKSIISQSFILYNTAKMLGHQSQVLSDQEFEQLSQEAERFPVVIQSLFEQVENKIKATAYANSSIENWFFIGRGIYYPVAMESALKFKEVSYRHAEGMPAGFFKHGTISLIDEYFYTVVFLPNKQLDEDTFRFTMSNISEIQARGGKVIAFGHEPEDYEDVAHLYDYIKLPSLNKHLDPLLHLIAGQLLAYYCAVSLGRNIDKPRSLAKSVTVR